MTDEQIAALIQESQALQPGGCCMADAWRGHLCSYHSGYRDGLERAQELMSPSGYPCESP